MLDTLREKYLSKLFFKKRLSFSEGRIKKITVNIPEPKKYIKKYKFIVYGTITKMYVQKIVCFFFF